MSKLLAYICRNCSYKAIKWLGCCPECKEWNSFDQEKYSDIKNQHKAVINSPIVMQSLASQERKKKERMTTDISEWDRVTGGGIMPGAFVVLTGDPGIGKSTLLLQIAHKLASKYKVFYFSSEESLEQVCLRAERLRCLSDKLLFADQSALDDIINTSVALKPDLIIIDSIQNCHAGSIDILPGTVAQLKEAAFKLMHCAKDNDIAIIASGHITKEGHMAGPKILEHMVDAVFYLQGEDRWQTRVLRSVKNRFGTINELGFFTMGEYGLEEVPHINQQLLEQIVPTPGSLVALLLLMLLLSLIFLMISFTLFWRLTT